MKVVESPPAAPEDWGGGELAAGELPAGGLPVGELPVGELPVGELPVGELPAGELPAGELPAGEPTPLVPGLGAGAAELPAAIVPGEPADD